MTISNPTLQREALVSRIRKLSKFTTQAGCTEGEAALALAKVRALIAEHNVTQDELSVRFEASRCITDEFVELNATVSDWTQICLPLSALYSTRCWYSKKDNADPLGIGMPMPIVQAKFFGLAADVAACIATCSIVYTAVSGEASKFKGHRISFRLGMIARLCERLREMKVAERMPTTGNALVVLKNALVTEEFARLNLRLRDVQLKRTVSDGASYRAGASAGSRVDLGAGKVTGQRQLGRS